MSDYLVRFGWHKRMSFLTKYFPNRILAVGISLDRSDVIFYGMNVQLDVLQTPEQLRGHCTPSRLYNKGGQYFISTKLTL